jgi:hypothetical protein
MLKFEAAIKRTQQSKERKGEIFMVHPLLISIVGRGVWVALGAGVGYLVASRDQKTEEMHLVKKVASGHVAFIVKDYEVVKVLEPGSDVKEEEVPGIINVKFSGHMEKAVAAEVQELLAKGKIKIGAIRAAVPEDIRSRLRETLEARRISEANSLIKESLKRSPGETAGDSDYIKDVCFWVWLIDLGKSLHLSHQEIEALGM